MKNRRQTSTKFGKSELPLKTNPLTGMNPILPLHKGNSYSMHYHKQNSLGMELYYYLTQGDQA